MTESQINAEKQVKKNRAAYLAREKELEITYAGKILLMHDGEVEMALNDDDDAYLIGCKEYGLGKFSLHRVGERPVQLGFAALGMEL